MKLVLEVKCVNADWLKGGVAMERCMHVWIFGPASCLLRERHCYQTHDEIDKITIVPHTQTPHTFWVRMQPPHHLISFTVRWCQPVLYLCTDAWWNTSVSLWPVAKVVRWCHLCLNQTSRNVWMLRSLWRNQISTEVLYHIERLLFPRLHAPKRSSGWVFEHVENWFW